MSKFLAILNARNKEFFRDRAALAWNFIFPLLLLAGFSFMFSNDGSNLYKIGILKIERENNQEISSAPMTNAFTQLKHISFVDYTNKADAILKVDQHKIDLLIDFSAQEYWVNETSAKGYIVEQLLLGSMNDFNRSQTSGRQIRYVDWVMPGILGMNMMFSCLFGVGYVIVRYRKNGVLKRFQATPLSAFEFLSAQVISRLIIVMAVTCLLFFGSNLLLDFYILGSLLDLFVIALLGSTAMISMSLLIASRSSSEEFTGGLLNFLSWPMMFLSGVWFSLEGAPDILQKFAELLPLTHILYAARAIMTDGATIADVSNNLFALTAMTIVFLLLGSWMFKWGSDRN